MSRNANGYPGTVLYSSFLVRESFGTFRCIQVTLCLVIHHCPMDSASLQIAPLFLENPGVCSWKSCDSIRIIITLVTRGQFLIRLPEAHMEACNINMLIIAAQSLQMPQQYQPCKFFLRILFNYFSQFFLNMLYLIINSILQS